MGARAGSLCSWYYHYEQKELETIILSYQNALISIITANTFNVLMVDELMSTNDHGTK